MTTSEEKKCYRVLSIDAWGECEGWTWNNWFKVGTIEAGPDEDLEALFADWILGDSGAVLGDDYIITDDGYNLVAEIEKTGEPLIALEYGVHTD